MEKKEEGRQKFLGSISAEKTKDLGHGVVEVVVSTESFDRHGEKISLDGISTKNYNGIVLYGHDYEGLPIGKALRVWRDKNSNALKAKVQFAIEEYPFAKTVYDLIQGGYLKDVSIGGIVHEWNDDYTIVKNLEMVEFSIVPVGANRDAKVIAAGIGKSLDTLQNEYYDAMRKHLETKVKEMPDREIKESVEALEKLLAALKGVVDKPEKNAVSSVQKVKYITMKQHAKGIDSEAEKLIKTIKVKLKK